MKKKVCCDREHFRDYKRCNTEKDMYNYLSRHRKCIIPEGIYIDILTKVVSGVTEDKSEYDKYFLFFKICADIAKREGLTKKVIELLLYTNDNVITELAENESLDKEVYFEIYEKMKQSASFLARNKAIPEELAVTIYDENYFLREKIKNLPQWKKALESI